MQKKTCFFIGHRDAPESIFPALFTEVERHIVTYGITNFITGHYGAFDRLAAKAVRQAKTRHPHVTLTMLLPYHPAEQPISVPLWFDDTLYPDGLESVPRRLAIIKANHYAIDHADHIISYVWHPASNSAALLDHARLHRKQICNLVTEQGN